MGGEEGFGENIPGIAALRSSTRAEQWLRGWVWNMGDRNVGGEGWI